MTTPDKQKKGFLDELLDSIVANKKQEKTAIKSPKKKPKDWLEEEDLDAELDKAARAAIPVLRQRVAEVPQQQPAAPEQSKALSFFIVTAKKDPKLNNGFHSFAMIELLLENSFDPPPTHDETLIQALGMDEENLYLLMRALLSGLQGRVVEKKDIVNYLTQIPLDFQQFLFDQLGLNDDSTEAEIKEKCELLKGVIDHFDELMSYPKHLSIMYAYYDIEADNEGKKTTREILAENKMAPGSDQIFDQAVAHNLIAQTYYSRFYRDNAALMPAFNMLNNLFGILKARPEAYAAHYQAQYCGGLSVDELKQQLDALFPEVPGMGDRLQAAAKQGSDFLSVIRAISEGFAVQSHEELRDRVEEAHRRIGRAFKDGALMDENDPYKHELEDEGKPEIDFSQHFDVVRKDPDPDTARSFEQLRQLHYALARTPEKYAEKSREQFGGDERDMVIMKLDNALGAELRAKFQQTAQAVGFQAPDQFYALMQVVAEHYNCSKSPERLKKHLIGISQILADKDMYPNLGN